MEPVRLTKGTTTGSTSIWIPDRYVTPTNISAYLVVTGAGSWSLEQTPDDIQTSATFVAASATWIRAEMSGLTANSSPDRSMHFSSRVSRWKSRKASSISRSGPVTGGGVRTRSG